jgi:hypothetical protein
MNPKMWKVVLLAFMVAQAAMAGILTVNQEDGPYKTISEAVKLMKDGDEIVITDTKTYAEQVTLENLKDITIRSEKPNQLKKPKIVWKDTKNVNPTTKAEALDSATIDFDKNGALQIHRCQNVVIDGIAVDGGGVFCFGSDDIWFNSKKNQHYPLQHGNAALNLWMSGSVIVRNCDLANAYFGIYFKDRNEGGIFANANPADIAKWKVVPMSGFGKTGNHTIEYSRIHNNSYGLFFESTWDIGVVVRYNLIFNNHHPDAQAAKIKAQTKDGESLPGGAISFKDHMLSPVAIYNNTFWHNFMNFIGGWQNGSHYLAFNNIYAAPHKYWEADANFSGASYLAIDAYLNNRTHNSVYACQKQKAAPQNQNVQVSDTSDHANPGKQIVKSVTTYQPQIMNGFGEVESKNVTIPIELSDGTIAFGTLNNVKMPGNLIVGTTLAPFPKSANVRWLEPKFMSTDSSSPDFLVPDWTDSVTNEYICDQGWVEAGIKDPDGSIADLGAKPKSGGQATTEIMIKPLSAVKISGTTATVSFNVYAPQIEGIKTTFKEPKIKYIRWINNVIYKEDSWGKDIGVLAASQIQNISITQPITFGSNSISFTVPSRTDLQYYAFAELVLEGKDANDSVITSTVGFLPYRKLEYEFDVKIFETGTLKELTTVMAGQNVLLKLVPRKIGDKTKITAPISPIDITLTVGNLYDSSGTVKFALSSLKDSSLNTVQFQKVAPGGGGVVVGVSGIYKNGDIEFAIAGNSKSIIVLPGDPAKVEFQDPPSKGKAVVDPGRQFTVKVQVYDKFDNKVSSAADVTLKSTAPDIGNVIGDGAAKSDSAGLALFKVEVTSGNLNDSFPIIATLKSNGVTDNATMVVGKNRDRLKIYYSDTLSYDENVKIDTCMDIRVPVTIRRVSVVGAIDSLINTGDESAIEFDITPSGNFSIYATEFDTVKISSAKLTKGQAVVWIESNVPVLKDGEISADPAVSVSNVRGGSRGGINFKACASSVESAAYFATNGFGRVDSLVIIYKDALKSGDIPDSLELFWPLRPGESRVIKKDEITTIDTLGKRITVKLSVPFADFKTSTPITANLGNSFTAVYPSGNGFRINDSVGPLVMSAVLMEKIGAGVDTIIVKFSEAVNYDIVKGKTLRLTKTTGGTEIEMNILSTEPISADEVKIVIEDLNDNAPKEGDSINIISTGTITDQFKNKAHVANRKVEINLKSIPPSIDSLMYTDENSDGIVDMVKIYFNKRVNADSLKCTFTWSADKIATSELQGSANIALSADGKVASVNVDGKFSNNNAVKNRTSGLMDSEISLVDFGRTLKPSVKDRAAPVIISAEYRPGEMISETESKPDILVVEFSETTTMLDLTEEMPFVFYMSTEEKLKMVKNGAGNKSNSFEFSIKAGQEALFPKNGDSINISTTPKLVFHDDGTNYQETVSNKKVPLKVNAVDYKVIVKIGPNPLLISRGGETTISVRALAKMVENIDIAANIAIYDAVGNKVFHATKPATDVIKGAVDFKWSGVNKNGRKVGAGTYQLIVETIKNGDRKVEPPMYIGIGK